MYTFKTPYLLPKIYPSLEWSVPADEKVIYLTFDDGPHPKVSKWVMQQLEQYNAKATFFCIGDNVQKHPDVYNEILEKGHKVGNHTFNHLNGWKTTTEDYINNIDDCSTRVQSNLFRPPYGRISSSQIRRLKKNYRLIMWSILTGDFDPKLNRSKSLKALYSKTKPGSIIVFHDSKKAENNLYYLLPKYLKHFSAKGYRFETL